MGIFEKIYTWFCTMLSDVGKYFVDLYQEFHFVMIESDRYKFILQGLKNTFVITIGSLAIGIVIGMIMALAKMSKHKALSIPANIYIRQECLVTR